ncbi:MAG: hypothetical protein PHD63_07220 [Candidatus Marinimicrobia bacterium]|nr:hypothetical protein [Candidatus Neomarinimicrobiota bacterium]
MLKIPFDTFLNDPREVHAFWIGITTAFRQKRRTPVPADIPERNRLEIADEYPYYLGGFYVARAAQIIVPAIAVKLAFF